MAVDRYNLLTTGTPKSWKASGGEAAITLASLANAAARQGAKLDLGAFWDQVWEVLLASSCAAAPTTGNSIELYWAASSSVTAIADNPGSTTGADAAFETPAEYKFQLLFIGQLYLSNAAGVAIQRQRFRFSPPCRYGMPVIVNSSGQALGATATDHEVRLTPLDAVLATTNAG